ncbi:hypothetical protein LMH87_006253 [Akanthomyces muscarius]|uniref:Uncharacterized protein n=1 Tax=Akanthomyces muscarius TaxID=2231603 RepID=A0A9W8QP72_AKAMU|nr:hypothetical protein LMH87_006253 [Akanthomyces muscarius]KAJ4164585.1 hypothetical protein LMH87_006253 [Akanthomyces muscarius]
MIDRLIARLDKGAHAMLLPPGIPGSLVLSSRTRDLTYRFPAQHLCRSKVRSPSNEMKVDIPSCGCYRMTGGISVHLSPTTSHHGQGHLTLLPSLPSVVLAEGLPQAIQKLWSPQNTTNPVQWDPPGPNAARQPDSGGPRWPSIHSADALEVWVPIAPRQHYYG